MAVIWITGLPGVGKTEVARSLATHLRARGEPCVVLDGDELRTALAPLDGGYEAAARRRLALAYSNLAALVSSQGNTAVVATVSLIADVHRENRSRFARYLEVLLSCGEAERARRRPPESLRGARHGVDIAPEFPDMPDLSLTTDAATPESLALRILERWHADA
jgi:adenylylsulfate kinase-like enzyme